MTPFKTLYRNGTSLS